MAGEAEDDVFFADLSRQIALLIMDDEEQLPVLHRQYPPLPFQELHYMPQIMIPPTYGYDHVAYTREMSKGTGVFIPRSATPRRKNRPRNKSSSVKNYNFPRQQLEKSAIVVSHVSSHTRGRFLFVSLLLACGPISAGSSSKAMTYHVTKGANSWCARNRFLVCDEYTVGYLVWD